MPTNETWIDKVLHIRRYQRIPMLLAQVMRSSSRRSTWTGQEPGRLTGGEDYQLRMFDFGGMKRDMRAFRKLEPSEGYPVNAVSFSPTGDGRCKRLGNAVHKACVSDEPLLALIYMGGTPSQVMHSWSSLGHRSLKSTTATVMSWASL